MRKLAWLLTLTAGGSALLTTGCAAGSAQYTESDHKKAVSADLGTTFYVSLPAAMTGKVAYSPKVLNLDKDGVDPAQRRILQFTAGALGETEIKVGTEYSLRVTVTSASDRPGMHIHQH